MTKTDHPAKTLPALVAQWYALACLLLAFARHVRWLEDAGASRAIKHAEMLEAGLHAALYEIIGDIAEQQGPPGRAHCREDAKALETLKTFARCFAAMVLIVQHIKLRLIIERKALVWHLLLAQSEASIGATGFAVYDPRPP